MLTSLTSCNQDDWSKCRSITMPGQTDFSTVSVTLEIPTDYSDNEHHYQNSGQEYNNKYNNNEVFQYPFDQSPKLATTNNTDSLYKNIASSKKKPALWKRYKKDNQMRSDPKKRTTIKPIRNGNLDDRNEYLNGFSNQYSPTDGLEMEPSTFPTITSSSPYFAAQYEQSPSINQSHVSKRSETTKAHQEHQSTRRTGRSRVHKFIDNQQPHQESKHKLRRPLSTNTKHGSNSTCPLPVNKPAEVNDTLSYKRISSPSKHPLFFPPLKKGHNKLKKSGKLEAQLVEKVQHCMALLLGDESHLVVVHLVKSQFNVWQLIEEANQHAKKLQDTLSSCAALRRPHLAYLGNLHNALGRQRGIVCFLQRRCEELQAHVRTLFAEADRLETFHLQMATCRRCLEQLECGDVLPEPEIERLALPLNRGETSSSLL